MSTDQKIDFDKMAEYYTMSSRTLMRWRDDKPQKFELMLDEYNSHQNTEAKQEQSRAEVVVVANFKGGVGKSTMSENYAVFLGDAAILNLDFSQPSAEINSCDTYDYAKYIEKYSIQDLINELSSKYKYIVIDTPGEVTPEVYEALKLTRKIIIPMTIGKRAREKTEITLKTFFGNGTELDEGEYKIYFLFNIV